MSAASYPNCTSSWTQPCAGSLRANGLEKFAVSHITLGRFKPGHHEAIPKLMELAAGLRARRFGDWQAQEVEIVRSELRSDGAEHVTMASFKLEAQ